MTTIVEFLTARIAEDEQAARTSYSPADPSTAEWTFDNMQVWADTRSAAHRILVVKHTWPHEGAHIARHDPARVLAEVAAKRTLVEVYGGIANQWPTHNDYLTCRLVLGALAAIYADHPDYRQEWTQ